MSEWRRSSITCDLTSAVLIAACVLLSLLVPFHAQAEQRIALIIANQAYPANIGALENTLKDGSVMQRALIASGFAVTLLVNGDSEEMKSAIDAFAAKLKEATQADGTAAGKAPVGFFYYSGHGSADPGEQENYLIPVRTPIETLDHLRTRGVRFSMLLDRFSGSGNTHNFAVFDACRNVLLPPAAQAPTKGLKPIAKEKAAKDKPPVLILYAADESSTTADDGVFADAIAQAISKNPGDNATHTILNARLIVAKKRSGSATQRLSPVGWSDEGRFVTTSDEDFYFQPKSPQAIKPSASANSKVTGSPDLNFPIEKSWSNVDLYAVSTSRYYKAPDLASNPIGELPAGTVVSGKVDFIRANGKPWYRYTNLMGDTVFSVADKLQTLDGG
jgi:hypothetical protein